MVYHKKSKLNKVLNEARLQKHSIGLVPTMGALHSGHLSLVEESLKENTLTVVSIFVNPTQFDNSNDLKKYPRTLNEDIALLHTVSTNIFVYAPEPTDLYGNTIQSKNYHFGSLEKTMEGAHRHGHFDGVGTVLNLLFRALKPNRAYFGKKDFQQLQIVKKLVKLEKLPIAIVGCPIVREDNGLAKSSRNKRLTETQRKEAALLSQCLLDAKNHFDTLSIPKIKKKVQAHFINHEHLVLEYFEIANEETLQPAMRKMKTNNYRAFIAAFAGKVRLIDNMALNS